ncbi:MAG: SnoaL-like domain-containing protein [Candidatus Methanofastidiosum sp.]|nr:SnoaL-like domain-containing protein [Methanofastidiosum sp.]
MKRIHYFAMCAFLVLGCKQNSQLSDKEINSIKSEVIASMHKAFENEKSLDAEKATHLYIDNGDFVFGGDGYLITDYSYLQKDFKDFLSSNQKWLDLNIHNEYVYVISKDAAAYSFEFDWKILRKDGDTLRCKNGSWTFVLRKIEDEWRSVHCNGAHIFE